MRLIDAEWVKAELLERYSEDDSRISEIACETIDNAPTVDKGYQEGHIDGVLQAEKLYARPQGEWIEGKNGNLMCNRCGCEIRYSYLIGNKPDFPKYCCECGAKMRGGA